MKLNIKKTIEENIISVSINVSELGTTTSVQTEELALLHDFPRSIRYSDITFTGNMKLDTNGDPVITSDSVDGTTVEEITISNLINREYSIDENLAITMSFDVTKIPTSELTTVFDTAEKLGKARAELFSVKIQEEIGKKLTELRSLNTKFEGETEVVL